MDRLRSRVSEIKPRHLVRAAAAALFLAACSSGGPSKASGGQGNVGVATSIVPEAAASGEPVPQVNLDLFIADVKAFCTAQTGAVGCEVPDPLPLDVTFYTDLDTGKPTARVIASAALHYTIGPTVCDETLEGFYQPVSGVITYMGIPKPRPVPDCRAQRM